MNTITITTLLLCTGLIAAGCEKTYSVAEFKKDEKLRDKWRRKCGWTGDSQNCKNLDKAIEEVRQENFDNYLNKYRKNDDKKKMKEQSESQQNSN
ncbi:EexN family lipoprotein [Bartonella massiliensis]|uniref:EexN family lipoprotein n=1 Tax=Bartonella massiliensis TaxID=929795 RepID=UPI0011589772|nr:EexN family lipoprotein [Bartonella massiliensis]